MFWSKNKNQSDKQKKQGKAGLQVSGGVNNSGKSQRIREEALANARSARDEIGAETLDKIAAMMTKKQQSAIEQAKAQIAKAEADKVIDELMFLLDKK